MSEIQLADATTGLILDATGLTVGDGTTLTAKITDHDTTAGKIVFAGGDITIGGTRTDEENTYTGATTSRAVPSRSERRTPSAKRRS